MKLLDYFFYATYSVLLRIKRPDWNAKWSSVLHISCWSAFFIIGFLSLIGIIYNNGISKLVIEQTNWLIIWIIFPVIYYLRYYKFKNIDLIAGEYRKLNRRKKIVWKVILLFVLIAVPVFSFISYRIYHTGQL